MISRYIHRSLLAAALLTAVSLGACSDSESYSDLLKEEERATNWYLARKQICLEIPEDSKFITGKGAPYYKMDEQGYVYMQVVNPGNGEKVELGDKVFFRYLRENIKLAYQGVTPIPEGNAGNLANNTSFIFGNYRLSSTAKYGSGIQLPLQYLSYNAEVNLVLRSYYGFQADMSQCIPYAVNVKYFKAEY